MFVIMMLGQRAMRRACGIVMMSTRYDSGLSFLGSLGVYVLISDGVGGGLSIGHIMLGSVCIDVPLI